MFCKGFRPVVYKGAGCVWSCVLALTVSEFDHTQPEINGHLQKRRDNMGINNVDPEDDQFAYRYDTQLLIDRRDEDLDEDEIADYITENFEGNSLIAAGDEDLVKIHFHTNEPWKVLEYCNSIGEIYDIVVEDMIRQAAGLQG